VAAEGLNSLETAYAFSPIPPGATPEQIKLVLGIQGNVWTENVEDWLKVQYQLLPRACAVAEIGWTPQEARDFGDFQRRLGYDFDAWGASVPLESGKSQVGYVGHRLAHYRLGNHRSVAGIRSLAGRAGRLEGTF
jgi:N-acetyl-beta-hexosaminidase